MNHPSKNESKVVDALTPALLLLAAAAASIAASLLASRQVYSFHIHLMGSLPGPV